MNARSRASSASTFLQETSATAIIRFPVLMSFVGAGRVMGQVDRFVARYESSDSPRDLERATELLLAAARRWPLADSAYDSEKLAIRVRLAGWAARLADPASTVDIELTGRIIPTRVQIERVARKDVNQHFSDDRFDKCGFVIEYDVPRVPDLQNVAIVVAVDGYRPVLLEPTSNVHDYLGRLGVAGWNEGSLPGFVGPAAEVVGYVDSVSVAPVYRASWRERRQLGLMSAIVGGSDLRREFFFLAIRCGMEDLARAWVEVGQHAGTLLPADQAMMLVALGEDDEARDVLSRTAVSEDGVTRLVASIDRMTDSACEISLAPSTVEVRPPSVWARRVAGAERTTLDVPALGVRTVNDARLIRGTTVLVDDSLQLYEAAADPFLGFVAGNWDHIVGVENRPDVCLVEALHDSEISIDEGILLSGRCDFNHFHFLIEYLPRVGLVDRLPRLDGVPLIVTDDLNPSSLEALDAVRGKRPVVTVSRDSIVRCKTLHIPSMHTYVPDSTRIPWIEGCRHSPTLLLEMRERLLDAFPPTGSFERAVYLARSSSARGLENGAEILEVAEAAGLQCVDPGSLTFRQQVDLFSNAELILGVGGAAFANLVLTQRGTKVLSLVSAQLHDFAMHSTMADLAGAEMVLLLGQTSAEATDFAYRRDYLHAPFAVDPGLVSEALRTSLNSPGSGSGAELRS